MENRKVSPVWATMVILAVLAIVAVAVIRSTAGSNCGVEYAGTPTKHEAVDVVRNAGRC